MATQSPSEQQTNPRLVYQFGERTFIENLAVRRNGHILLSTFRDGSLFDLDPNAANPEANLVAELPGVSSLVGIAETADDVFAVGGGTRVPEGFGFIQGSMRVFRVDMNKKDAGAGASDVVAILADLPDTRGLNGMCALPGRPSVVLGADSKAGRILRIDTATGRVDAPIVDALLRPSTDPAIVPIGVNGIRASGEYLYFSNSGLGFFGRVRITADGERAGEVERIAGIENPAMMHAYDDFAVVASDGGPTTAYVTLHANAVQKIGVDDGSQTSFVGGGESTLLKNPTSAALSRDRQKLYICTAGGQVVEVGIAGDS